MCVNKPHREGYTRAVAASQNVGTAAGMAWYTVPLPYLWLVVPGGGGCLLSHHPEASKSRIGVKWGGAARAARAALAALVCGPAGVRPECQCGHLQNRASCSHSRRSCDNFNCVTGTSMGDYFRKVRYLPTCCSLSSNIAVRVVPMGVSLRLREQVTLQNGLHPAGGGAWSAPRSGRKSKTTPPLARPLGPACVGWRPGRLTRPSGPSRARPQGGRGPRAPGGRTRSTGPCQWPCQARRDTGETLQPLAAK